MDKKPKVIAFYRDHVSIALLVEEAEAGRIRFNERRGFIRKQLDDLRKEEENFGDSATKLIVAECERLNLLAPGELIARGEHVHYDTDTMTIQRCNHDQNSAIAQLLGFTT